LVRNKLFGFIIAFLGFSSSAFAGEGCPDMQGSYRSPNNAEGSLTRRVDYWVIPTKANVRSIDGQKTLNNLARTYPLKNKPSFTCYGRLHLSGVDTCETPNKVYFNPDQSNTEGIRLPSKNGEIVVVGLKDLNVNVIVLSSCRKKVSITYDLSGLYQKGQPNYPSLPYLLLTGESTPIFVQEYRAAPQF
jgi:hypothetical protein